MSQSFLLSRILLQFDSDLDDLLGEISAIARTPDGSLWVGSDEFMAVERLSPIAPGIYGKHQKFHLADFVELFDHDSEVDIEGMDYSDGYLWLVGSHSTKRNKTKGKKVKKDIQRLAEIETDPNRYLLARIPIINGAPVKTCDRTDQDRLSAAALRKVQGQSSLIEALAEDEHIGPFLKIGLPSKDNGLDIEGLAVCGDRLFLGLRGPVLRGWAIILELELAESEPGTLTLQPLGDSEERYRKHFVDLNGLGIRELCLRHDDLIILAGPTMDLEGAMQVFLLEDVLDHSQDTLWEQDSGALRLMFNLPFTIGSDHAEGLTLMPCLGDDGLMIVYDTPDEARRPNPTSVFADVFQLPPLDKSSD
ncbi:DUF3616 domain-containing protein [Romeria aff. gracilis LEGE 07310]|uniref:DUF3616 domain-containing protein n=1 Tax=Vasconcelosia minhoensis LEGE 07310 TaxID=915328 RepID=A0A8J7DD25_9CYAN|nr:DUF3616 domain-containing protein [Romeria gracilis]MBE9079477.1 DUF3616 domain-containing protein [Romeria aff. gracilis LEGE 07310]